MQYIQKPEVKYVIRQKDGTIKVGYHPCFSTKKAQVFLDLWGGELVSVTISGHIQFEFEQEYLNELPDFWKPFIVDPEDL